MKNNDHQITADEAHSALKSLDATNRSVTKACRPPLWLAVLASFLLALETISTSFSSGNSLWTFIAIISTVAFILSIIFWIWRLRQWGLAVKIMPVGIADKVFSLAQGLFIAVIIVGSQTLYKNGFTWIPYAAALMNAVALLYLLHHFPTGQWLEKDHRK